MANNHIDAENLGESSFIGLAVSIILHQLMPFAIHTAAAVISGIIATTCIFFFNRWLKKTVK